MIRIAIKKENEDAVASSLEQTDGKVRFACATGLARGLLVAAGNAQRHFLSGPRPEKLDVRTTRLRQSISSEVEVDGNNIIGRIGSNVPYAAYHEFGFHGKVTQHVAAFNRVRQISITNGTVRVIQSGRTKALAKKLRRKGLVEFSQVRAFDRTYQVNYAGRPFLRPALEETDLMAEVNKELLRVRDE